MKVFSFLKKLRCRVGGKTKHEKLVSNQLIERFSNDCRKTKTKAITPTNHNRSRQRDEPITIPSNYLLPGASLLSQSLREAIVIT